MPSNVVFDKSQITSPVNAHRPEHSAGQRRRPDYLEGALSALIFVISLLYLFLFRRHSGIDPDEGIVLQGADRILRGEVPYRDFFSFYTPGSFYLVAALFKVFGNSFLVARTSIAVVGAGCSVITYLLSRRVCSRKIALLAAAFTMTNSVAYRFLVLHNWYSTFFACLTIFAAVKLLESEKPGWGLATGSLAALTILIEQSKGAGLCLGLVVGFLILVGLGGRLYIHFRGLMVLAVGFLWPWIGTFSYFTSRHAVKIMLQDWSWPLLHYTRANHVPYGYQNWTAEAREAILHSGPMWVRIVKYIAVSPGFIVPLLPLVGLVCLAYWSRRIWKNKKDTSANSDYYVLVSAALSGLLLSIVVVRADIAHVMDLAPLWYVVLAWVLGTRNFQSTLLKKLRPALIVYFCVSFGLMSLALILNINGTENRIQTRRGVVMTSGKDTVLDYVQAHLPAGAGFLVYPYLPLYNYLTETHSPARLDFFQAGMNTTVQARGIIADLKSKKINAVLFEPGFPEKFATSWPETPLRDVANDPVADFIIRNYRVCAALITPQGWRFQFMVRKEENCT
jgi:4-amino-4-deoxy-L-arabinose transferase-like glycosyltransferase